MIWVQTDTIAQEQGVKVLGYGGPGTGKTRLCATAPDPVIFSVENGLLSLRKVKIFGIVIRNMADLTEAYRWAIGSAESRYFQTLCLDSYTEIADVVLLNERQLTKDGRKAYFEMQEKMLQLAKSFRDIPGKNVYFSAKIEQQKDEATGALLYQPSFPGSKLGPQLPYLFDEVFRVGTAKDNAGQTFGYLQTQSDGQSVAKDRSGALDFLEPQDLSHVFRKIKGT